MRLESVSFFSRARVRSLCTCFLSVLLILGHRLEAQVDQNGDFQLWEFVSVNRLIKGDFAAHFIGEMRWGDDASKLYYAYPQLQIVYDKKWVEIAPGYRQEFFRPEKEWFNFYSPMIDITFFTLKNTSKTLQKSFPASKWLLEDRNRIFYQIPEHDRPNWIYRNRLRLSTPQVTSSGKIRFFIDDEVFFQERQGFNQNRLSIGLFTTLTSYLQGRVLYIYRNLKQQNIWTHQNVLAGQFYFSF